MAKKSNFKAEDLFDSFLDEALNISLSQASTSIGIVDFAENIIFNGESQLYPPQRAILKAFYGEPLSEDELMVLYDWKEGQEIPRTTWVDGREYSNLVLEAGRGSGKSVMIALLALYEFYNLITLEDPAVFYGKLSGSPIDIFAIAQSLDQVKQTLFKAIKGFIDKSKYFSSLVKNKTIEVYTEEIKCPKKNISLYAKHCRTESLVGYTIKCLILDEVSRFENDEEGKSKADSLWDNIGRSCQYKEDLIYTSEGSLTHKELLQRQSKDLKILTLDPKTYKQHFTNNYEVWSNGIQDIYTLNTKTGLEGNFTSNHPFLVWKDNSTNPEWVELQNLKVGDRLATLKNLNFNGNLSSVSKAKARLIGYLLGDGGITTGTIRFTNINENIIKDFKDKLAKEYPGYTLITYDKNDPINYVVKSLGKNIPNLFKKDLISLGLMGKGHATKFIPQEIINSPNEILAELILGLFSTDGYVSLSNSCSHLGIGLTNKQIIETLQRELLRYSVNSSVRTKANSYFKSNKKNGNTSYVLEIRDKNSIINFLTNIGSIPGKENRQLELVKLVENRLEKSTNGLAILPKGVTKRILAIKEKNNLSWSNLLGKGYGGIRKDNSISCSLLKELSLKLNDSIINSLVNSDIVWDTVKSIDFFKQDETIAISVPETHIIGNPIISHNTVGRFGKHGRRIAISSAWEPGDSIEKLYNLSERSADTLGFRLKTWQVNLDPTSSEEVLKNSADYIKDPIRAATEYEGIRSLREGTFFVKDNVANAFKGISFCDAYQIPLDITNDAEDVRHYVALKVNRLDISIDKPSFAHCDYGIKKDAAALAVCSPIQIEDKWGVSVDILLCWKPYLDRDKSNKAIQRIVSFTNCEEIFLNISKSRRIQKFSFDSFNSEATKQRLHLAGIPTCEMPTATPMQNKYFTTTKLLMDQGLLVLPKDSRWSTTAELELQNIFQLPNGKLSHPKEHGKDLADAICNSVYNCYLHMIQTGKLTNSSLIAHVNSISTRKGINNSAVQKLKAQSGSVVRKLRAS